MCNSRFPSGNDRKKGKGKGKERLGQRYRKARAEVGDWEEPQAASGLPLLHLLVGCGFLR
jgi:hypothetical protein